MDADERRYKEITHQMIGAAFDVANEMGLGYLEKVYENSLAEELRRRGLGVQQQFPIPVHYKGTLVGNFVADLLVDGLVLVELKYATGLDDAHLAKCINYLKATGIKVCLLINFGTEKVEYKRIVRGL